MTGRLILVPCGAMKADHPRPARDLYLGSTFRLARAAAERDGRAWAILSAQYGIVEPDQVIEPYERTLRNRTDVAVLVALLGRQPHRGPVEAWTPARYVDALREAGYPVIAPLAGLSQGHQRHWFKHHAREPEAATR